MLLAFCSIIYLSSFSIRNPSFVKLPDSLDCWASSQGNSGFRNSNSKSKPGEAGEAIVAEVIFQEVEPCPISRIAEQPQQFSAP